jgi:hypothetical protein
MLIFFSLLSQSFAFHNLKSESNCFLSVFFYKICVHFSQLGNATSAEVVMSELDEPRPRRETRQKSNTSVVEEPIEEEENDEVGPAQVLTDSRY